MHQHAGRHRGDEHDHWRRQRREIDQRRPRTEPDQAPADAEDRRPDNQRRLNLCIARPVRLRRQIRPSTSLKDREARRRNDKRGRHHHQQRRIPGAEHVEEAEHLRRLHHPGDQEAPAEHEAASKRCERRHVSLRSHDA
jgi:hypothetical protein